MREFVMDLTLAGCSVKDFFELCIEPRSFNVRQHEASGDTNIDVSDWLEAGEARQRIVFFTRHNSDGSTTKCIEMQKFEYVEDGDTTRLLLESSVNPENPLGNVFLIEQKTQVSPSGTGCTLRASVKVACKKALLGGWANSSVERLLATEARNDTESWFARIKTVVREAREAASASAAAAADEASSSSNNSVVGDEISDSDEVRIVMRLDGKPGINTKSSASGYFNRHQLRYRISNVGHGIVQGITDPVSSLLNLDDGDYARPFRAGSIQRNVSMEDPGLLSNICPPRNGHARGRHRRTAAQYLILISVLVVGIYLTSHLLFQHY